MISNLTEEQEFDNILEQLLHVKDEDNFKKIFGQIKILYIDKNFQHQHSAISTFILKQKEKIDEASMDLAQNLRKIEELAEQSQDSKDMDRLLKKIKRLSDHTNLECIHVRTIKEIDSKTQEVEQKTHKSDEQIHKIQAKAKAINKRLKNQQAQYITILGVFASIVMAFVGGLTFSTSVLSHMHEVSIYRLVFVICCIGFLIFNILFALFGFVLKIVEKENDYCVFQVVNGILIAILAINVLCYNIYGKEEKEPPKQEVNLSIKAKTK